MAKKKEEKIKIGDRFGKLEVINTHVGIPKKRRVKDENGKTYFVETKVMNKAWLCKCDCGKTLPVTESVLLTESSIVRSCGCSKEINPNYIPTKLTAEEVKEWDELYEYVRCDIMGYNTEMALSQQMVTRLKGLLNGKFIANNKSRDYANYSFSLVLNTFKYCSLDIKRGLANNSFNNEWHKFLYITKIVENNLSTVYVKMENVKKAKEDAQNITLDIVDHVGATYQRKTKETNNKLLDDLW